MGQTMPFTISRLLANASSVEMPMHGFFESNARPFIVAAPIRTPVNEPGPAEQAKMSISSIFIQSIFKIASIIGKRVSL